jgi:hypothetical protein
VLDGAEAVASMVRTALAPPAESTRIVDARWGVSRSIRDPLSYGLSAPATGVSCEHREAAGQS